MLGYIVLKAEEDMYIKREDSHFIYKKDNIYVARYDYNDILIFDERDNACTFGYFRPCMSLRLYPHYSEHFRLIAFKEAVNSKEFYKIRKELRQEK